MADDRIGTSGWTFAQVPVAIIMHKALSSSAKVLYAYLGWRQGTDAGCWPAIATVAKDLGATNNTVRRWIRELQDAGVLVVTERPGHSNLYSLVAMPCRNVTPIENDSPIKNDRIGAIKNDTQNDSQLDDIDVSNDTSDAVPAPSAPAVPAEKRQPRKRKPTEWERIRWRLGKAFSDKTGIPIPKRGQGVYRQLQAMWWGPLRTLYDLAGQDVPRTEGLIEQAVNYNRSQKLNVISPQSIEKTAIAVATREPPKVTGGATQSW